MGSLTPNDCGGPKKVWVGAGSLCTDVTASPLRVAVNFSYHRLEKSGGKKIGRGYRKLVGKSIMRTKGWTVTLVAQTGKQLKV